MNNQLITETFGYGLGSSKFIADTTLVHHFEPNIVYVIYKNRHTISKNFIYN